MDKCEKCAGLEIELAEAKTKIKELAALCDDYSKSWAYLNSEVETLRIWRNGVLRAAGITEFPPTTSAPAKNSTVGCQLLLRIITLLALP